MMESPVTLRDDVMETVKTMVGYDPASLVGQWLLVENDEPATIEAVVTLRDGAIWRNKAIVGRYLVFERHVELWQDKAPVIFFWRGSDDLLVGWQEYKLSVEGGKPGEVETYRVSLILDRVKDGQVRGMEPKLDLELA
jgi:hypothetical protein